MARDALQLQKGLRNDITGILSRDVILDVVL